MLTYLVCHSCSQQIESNKSDGWYQEYETKPHRILCPNCFDIAKRLAEIGINLDKVNRKKYLCDKCDIKCDSTNELELHQLAFHCEHNFKYQFSYDWDTVNLQRLCLKCGKFWNVELITEDFPREVLKQAFNKRFKEEK